MTRQEIAKRVRRVLHETEAGSESELVFKAILEHLENDRRLDIAARIMAGMYVNPMYDDDATEHLAALALAAADALIARMDKETP